MTVIAEFGIKNLKFQTVADPVHQNDFNLYQTCKVN